ncbi:MAG: GNAT family N-acetyltransferase [Ignavibacteriae bacterium]|nr:GNAT family N-acetyltransferase [Ignavibacteriota bacterium]MCB9220579.1 GNAT family N-acetyltransferase [Ignavibacteria bacterium]
MKISIRRANEDDLDAVLSLYYDTVKVINSKHYSPEQIEAWLDDETRPERFLLKINEQLFYVCMNEIGELLGFSSISKDGYLDLLYASTTHQRNGVGTLLLEQMLVASKIYRFKRIDADVSITAVPFFLSKGFEIQEEQVIERNGVKLTNIRMTKYYTLEN